MTPFTLRHLGNVLFLSLLVLIGCSEHPSNSIHDDHGSIQVSIQHVFDSVPFTFNKANSLPNGESVKGTMLKYYVSNISLEKTDGSTHVIPQDESYFLIDESIESTKKITLDHIPSGTYIAIRLPLELILFVPLWDLIREKAYLILELLHKTCIGHGIPVIST